MSGLYYNGLKVLALAESDPNVRTEGHLRWWGRGRLRCSARRPRPPPCWPTWPPLGETTTTMATTTTRGPLSTLRDSTAQVRASHGWARAAGSCRADVRQQLLLGSSEGRQSVVDPARSFLEALVTLGTRDVIDVEAPLF